MKSPNTIKPCYIAVVKEEMGLPVTPAHNRIGAKRKVQPPKWLKPFIRQAIRELASTKGKATYKEIQRRTLEIYMENKQKSKVMETKGILKGRPKEVRAFINDKEIFYTL